MLKGDAKKRKIAKQEEMQKHPIQETLKEQIENEALKRYVKAMESKEGEKKKAPSDLMMKARRRVIHEGDIGALERILGKNDLLPISYLQKGMEVSKAVCRLIIRDRYGASLGYGTGFLVGPGMLLTNHHVIPDKETAKNSVAEFDYQSDENFVPCPVSHFSLLPDTFFVSHRDLDFALVAVASSSAAGKGLDDYGYIRLFSEGGKVVEGEYVSIIQHPRGGPKAVTLRENKVNHILDRFIHYMTDTEPGSSGSPVFNDQWVTVGLHHAGVPDPDKKGNWLANEGVRISAISSFLRSRYPAMDDKKKALLNGVFPDMGEKKDADSPTTEDVIKGYDSTFLGKKYKVALPKLSPKLKDDVSKMKNGRYILDYVHFSIVMSRSRGLAYFTAVNIDGNQKVKIRRTEEDNWKFDSRISEEYQYGNEVYERNDLDRGHLVKREDPNWGEHAKLANEDTFFFTNSAPQHKDLNQKIWLGLEDYILKNAHNENLKISVFTGPVFRESDMVYRKKYKIPADFWKVVVMVKKDGLMSATAYLQTQEDMLKNLEFVYGQYETYQVPISKIEELTGLDFGKLSNFDPLANIESTGLLIKNKRNIRL